MPASPRIDTSKLKSIQVLFEDDELLVVSKPAGMSVHGGAGEPGPTLIDLLRAAHPLGEALNLAHRLDRATSGVVLSTKRKDIAAAMTRAWDSADKAYIAVALGAIAAPLEIIAPIEGKHGAARDADTRVRPLARLEAVEPHTTLIAVTLGTGRTHQIRLHLAARRHPLLLDDKHGDFAANKAWTKALREAGAPRPKSLMLHARTLTLEHPRTSERISFTASPPGWWREVVARAGADVDAIEELS